MRIPVSLNALSHLIRAFLPRTQQQFLSCRGSLLYHANAYYEMLRANKEMGEERERERESKRGERVGERKRKSGWKFSARLQPVESSCIAVLLLLLLLTLPLVSPMSQTPSHADAYAPRQLANKFLRWTSGHSWNAKYIARARARFLPTSTSDASRPLVRNFLRVQASLFVAIRAFFPYDNISFFSN